jgi:hypothetical protein
MSLLGDGMTGWIGLIYRDTSSIHRDTRARMCHLEVLLVFAWQQESGSPLAYREGNMRRAETPMLRRAIYFTF